MAFIQQLRDLSFRTRLVLLVVIFTSIPSLINLIISYQAYSQDLKEQYIDGARGLLTMSAENLDTYYTDLISYIDFPYYDALFLEYIKDRELRSSYIHNSYVNEFLQSALLNNREIMAVSLYVDRWNKLFLADPQRTVNQTIDSPGDQWLGDLSGENQRRFNHITWIFDSPIEQVVPVREHYAVTLRRSLYHNFEYLGMYYFDLDMRHFQKATERLRTNPEEFIYIMDRNGRLLYASGEGLDTEVHSDLLERIIHQNEESEVLDFGAKPDSKIILYQKLESAPWIMIKGISRSSLDGNILSRIWLNAGIQVGFTVVAIVFSIMLSIWLYRPLLVLVQGIHRVNQGQLNFEIKPSGGKEIVSIIHSFNRMMRRLHHMIEEEYKTQIHLQRAQLKALQAQINPHFLYNAFQVIGSMAVEKGAEEINEVTYSLARMCRYSIRPGEDAVFLKEEIEHIHHYLKIQKLRFHDDLEYHIHVDNELQNLTVPKLSLLPLVENSFVHGFSIREHAKVEITAKREGSFAVLRIADNGQGFTEERRLQVEEWLDKSGESMFEHERIGLNNVQERMMQYFGPDAKLAIDSHVGKGTVIIIRIPYTGGADPC